MGKLKDADEEVEGLPIDADTTDMLEGDVKKGKTRKFILIYRGVQINKLIVFKKGPYNTRIQKAKKDGFRGECVCGIVTGSGVNLTFQLPGNSGVADAMSVDQPVDGEPTKVIKLKEFLADNNVAGRKPEYQLVCDVQFIAKSEEADSGEDNTEASSSPNGTAPPPPAEQPADSDLATKCNQVKSVLLPKIKQAAAASPDKTSEITRLLATASEQEKAQSFGDALGTFKKLAETVKDVLVGGDSDKSKYEANLPKAELKIKLLRQYPEFAGFKPEFDKLDAFFTQAKTHAKNGKYDDANKELAKLLAGYAAVKTLADRLSQERGYESGLKVRFENLKLHQGRAVITAAQFNQLQMKLTELDKAITARRWPDVDTLWTDISDKLNTYKELANRSGDYIGLRNNALLSVKALETHPNGDVIKNEIASIKKDRIEAAKIEFETKKDYPAARALLADVDKLAADAKKKADAQAGVAFKKLVDAAELKLNALNTPEKAAIVPTEIAVIKATIAKARIYVSIAQFPDATKLLAAATKDCGDAEKMVAQQLVLRKAEKAADDSTASIEKSPKAAVASVQKLHDELTKHSQEPVIRTELAAIQKKIDQAKVAIA